MNPFELNNKMLKRIYILQTGLQNAYTKYQSHIPLNTILSHSHTQNCNVIIF